MRALTENTRQQRENLFKKLENLEKFLEKGELKKIIYPSAFFTVVFMLIIIFFIPILIETNFFWKIIIYMAISVVVFALFDGAVFRRRWQKKAAEKRRLEQCYKSIFYDMLKNSKEKLSILEKTKDGVGIKECQERIRVLERTQNPQLS